MIDFSEMKKRMQTFGFDINKKIKENVCFLVFCVAIFPRKAIKITVK